MSGNPDNKNYIGLGPEDMRYLIPTAGMLRFVERAIIEDGADIVPTRRILQQYQWCVDKSGFGWYDVPLATE